MKKLLSIALSVTILLGILAMGGFSVFADDVIEIDSADDFYAIVDNLGGSYKLTADITIDKFIGLKDDGSVDESKAFSGTLDGNGKTITFNYAGNNNNRTGIFAQADGATIKNLTVNANVALTGTTATGNSCAAVVGTVKSGNTTTFTNVSVTGSVSSDKCLAMGAIIGAIESNGTTVLESCSNTADLTMEARDDDAAVGGLIGSLRSNDHTITVTDCTVDADIVANYSSDRQRTKAGGMIGSLRNKPASLTVNGGSVAGTITAERGAAGVIAFIQCEQGAVITVDGVKVSADITVKSDYSDNRSAGGIIGTSTTRNLSLTIKNCEVSGKVDGANCVAGAYIGGYASTGNGGETQAVLTNNTFTGTLISGGTDLVALGIAGNNSFNVWGWGGVNLNTEAGTVSGSPNFDNTPNTDGMKAYVNGVEATIDSATVQDRQLNYTLSNVSVTEGARIRVLLVFADGTYYSFASNNGAAATLVSTNAGVEGTDYSPEFIASLVPDDDEDGSDNEDENTGNEDEDDKEDNVETGDTAVLMVLATVLSLGAAVVLSGKRLSVR